MRFSIGSGRCRSITRPHAKSRCASCKNAEPSPASRGQTIEEVRGAFPQGRGS